MIQITWIVPKPSYGKICYCDVPNTILILPIRRLPRILFHTSSTQVNETYRTSDRLDCLRHHGYGSGHSVHFRLLNAPKWVNNCMKNYKPIEMMYFQSNSTSYEHRDQDQSRRSNRGLHRSHVDGAVC